MKSMWIDRQVHPNSKFEKQSIELLKQINSYIKTYEFTYEYVYNNGEIEIGNYINHEFNIYYDYENINKKMLLFTFTVGFGALSNEGDSSFYINQFNDQCIDWNIFNDISYRDNFISEDGYGFNSCDISTVFDHLIKNDITCIMEALKSGINSEYLN